MAVIKARLVKIGNSRGIRIPKVLIDQIGLGTEVEIAIKDKELVIRPSGHPRQGWDEQFRKMAERGDDQLLDNYVPTKWDETEWTW